VGLALFGQKSRTSLAISLIQSVGWMVYAAQSQSILSERLFEKIRTLIPDNFPKVRLTDRIF